MDNNVENALVVLLKWVSSRSIQKQMKCFHRSSRPSICCRREINDGSGFSKEKELIQKVKVEDTYSQSRMWAIFRVRSTFGVSVSFFRGNFVRMPWEGMWEPPQPGELLSLTIDHKMFMMSGLLPGSSVWHCLFYLNNIGNVPRL